MQRPWPYPRIIGHRGGGSLAPENTLAGFRKASAMGFGAVEFDVMLSADKVPLHCAESHCGGLAESRERVLRSERAATAVSDDPGMRPGPLHAAVIMTAEERDRTKNAGKKKRGKGGFPPFSRRLLGRRATGKRPTCCARRAP